MLMIIFNLLELYDMLKIIIRVTRRVKGYTRFVGKYVILIFIN